MLSATICRTKAQLRKSFNFRKSIGLTKTNNPIVLIDMAYKIWLAGCVSIIFGICKFDHNKISRNGF